MARELQITVDHDLCMGNGQCVFLAPEVFRHNDEPPVRGDRPGRGARGADPSGRGFCPTGAISVADARTGERLFP